MMCRTGQRSVTRSNETLASCFRAFLRTDTGRYLVKRFREEYPHAGISKVKMLDFVLWQTRPKITLAPERRSRARPARRIKVSVARISASYQHPAADAATPRSASRYHPANEGGPR